MTVTVHQLDGNRVCWREYEYHPATALEREALYARIERAYSMAATMVTAGGRYEFGAHGHHHEDGEAAS